MKGYELLYIVGTQFTDPEIEGIGATIATMLETAGAKVLKTQNLGKIKLAYPIKKVRHGTYILVYFNADPSAISDFSRRMELTDEVLRHMILERPSDALERTFEISSYVAPMSDEARTEKEPKRMGTHTNAKTPTAPSAEPVQIAPPTPASAEEAAMSMEELDQKLDQILDGDIAENI